MKGNDENRNRIILTSADDKADDKNDNEVCNITDSVGKL